jgi:hypothetical protein
LAFSLDFFPCTHTDTRTTHAQGALLQNPSRAQAFLALLRAAFAPAAASGARVRLAHAPPSSGGSVSFVDVCTPSVPPDGTRIHAASLLSTTDIVL